MLHLFCPGFAIFLTAASIFAQSNGPTPPSGKGFKSIPIVPAKEAKPWSINFAPYGWVTAVDRTIALRGITSHVHESAIETLKSLDFAFMAATEIRYKRWGSWATLSTQRCRASQARRVAFFSQLRPRTWKNLSEPSCSNIDPLRRSGASWMCLLAHGSMPLQQLASAGAPSSGPRHHPLRYLGGSHHRDERPDRDFALVFHQCLRRPRRIRSGIGIHLAGAFGFGFQVSRWFALIAGYRALGYNFRQNDTTLDLISTVPT